MSINLSIPSPSDNSPPTTPISPNASPASASPNPAPAASNDAQPKRKASRRANTAERRATHNAVERQRRETLNGRFLDLAALLPNLATVRRPSKSAIVNSSIALIHSQRRARAIAGRELRALEEENAQLRREVNEWRSRSAMLPALQPPPRSQDFISLINDATTLDDKSVEEEERRAYLLAGAPQDDDEDDWVGSGLTATVPGHVQENVVNSASIVNDDKLLQWQQMQQYAALQHQQQQQQQLMSAMLNGGNGAAGAASYGNHDFTQATGTQPIPIPSHGHHHQQHASGPFAFSPEHQGPYTPTGFAHTPPSFSAGTPPGTMSSAVSVSSASSNGAGSYDDQSDLHSPINTRAPQLPPSVVPSTMMAGRIRSHSLSTKSSYIGHHPAQQQQQQQQMHHPHHFGATGMPVGVASGIMM